MEKTIKACSNGMNDRAVMKTDDIFNCGYENVYSIGSNYYCCVCNDKKDIYHPDSGLAYGGPFDFICGSFECNDFIHLWREHKICLLYKDGSFSPWFDATKYDYFSYTYGVAVVEVSGKLGLYDLERNFWSVGPFFDKIEEHNNFFIAHRRVDGTIIVEKEYGKRTSEGYDDILYITERICRVEKDGKYKYIRRAPVLSKYPAIMWEEVGDIWFERATTKFNKDGTFTVKEKAGVRSYKVSIA